MKQIPLKAVERQSLSIMLDNQLYEITLKECNGIMAASIAQGGNTVVGFRRVCAGVPLLPPPHSSQGNFIFTSLGDELPYFTNFESTDQLYYLTSDEIASLETGGLIMLPVELSSPLVDFDYQTDKTLPNYLSIVQPGLLTYTQEGLLKNAAANTPRFEDAGLLLEYQTTRYTFAMGYANGETVNRVGPEGTTVPVHKVNPVAGAYSYVRGTCPTLTGSYIISFYAKRDDGDPGLPIIYTGTDGGFNTCSSYYLGNGWWKLYRITPNPKGNTGAGFTPFAPQPPYSVLVTAFCVEEDVTGMPTSFVKGGNVVTRLKDGFTYSLKDAKWVFIQYLDKGVVKKLLYPYSGELVTPRNINLQRLLVWNREPTATEKEELGV